jgi:hypothetical protein
MKSTALLHNLLKKSQAIKHKTRLTSLLNAVEAVMHGGKLSLSSIGRHMIKPIKTRSKIQTTNYLLGNPKLFNEAPAIYTAVTAALCSGRKEIYILIDWSSVIQHKTHLLRASMVVKGRSNVLYQELHPEKNLGTLQVHARFLQRLHAMIPDGISVCIVTDAGFKTDFFQQVTQYGWHFVGRLLSNMVYLLDGQEQWKTCASLYEQADEKARFIGSVQLSKATRIEANLYQLKKLPKKKAVSKKRTVNYGRKEKEHNNAAKKPWLIATSLKTLPTNIMKIYKSRMKIEHDFRDTKDPCGGIGLRVSRCKDPFRLTLLLLIGALSIFLLWLIGLCLEKNNLHYDFQANSYKHRRVLSLVFLALEAIQSKYLWRIKSTLLSFLDHPEDFIDDSLPVQIMC